MEVVKTPVKYEVTCADCGAVIQFFLDEVSSSPYGGKYIYCPECGAKLQTHYNDFEHPILNGNIRVIYAEDIENDAY